MSFSLAVVVPLILYAILIAAAALEDGLRVRISNVTNVAILVLGVLTLALNWNGEWWQHLLAFVIALTFGVGLFSIGWLGGGDAKFVAATAFAFDLEGLMRFLLCTTIAGGILAFLYLGTALLRRRREGMKRRSLPYGIAIAAGAALTWWLSPDSTILASHPWR